MVNLAGVDLNLLVVFEAVMSERSVTRAGQTVGLSQSAVSNSLARLRDLFKDPVFVRRGTAMVPTPRALELQPHLSTALDLVRNAFMRPRFEPASSRLQFRIASSDDAELAVLPHLVRKLGEVAPGITVSMRRLNELWAPPAEALESGELDFAIGAFAQPPVLASGLHAHALYGHEACTIARSGHSGVGKKLSLRQFLQAAHVVTYYPGEGPGLIDRILSEKGLKRKVAVSVPDFLSVPFLVARSDLLATVPAVVAKAFRSATSLSIFRCPVALPPLSMNILWHVRSHKEPSHVWFRMLLAELARESAAARMSQ